uniref:Uncharacterized protein n=1 Tax=Cacopsylla melanoneura TaxID=428564 RepID=A0A8D8WXT7_9HEMI
MASFFDTIILFDFSAYFFHYLFVFIFNFNLLVYNSTTSIRTHFSFSFTLFTPCIHCFLILTLLFHCDISYSFKLLLPNFILHYWFIFSKKILCNHRHKIL